MELLFLLAYWQGLAKLRLHTEITLNILDRITRALGMALRAFKKETCPKFDTKELPREAATRQRREAKSTAKQSSSAKNAKGKEKEVKSTAGSKTGKGKEKEVEPTAKSNFQSSRQPKGFNLNTYKLHSLGDYANTIRQYGTTDSYSTQLVRGVFPSLHITDEK
jgi:uncharacterized protein YdaU (DUF1376 family)